MTILSRPTRLVKGKRISTAVNESLFENEYERHLHAAAQQAAARVTSDMSIPDFLKVSHVPTPLTSARPFNNIDIDAGGKG